MNLLDSSAWIEFFIGGKNAETFKNIIRQTDQLIVPTIVLYEVCKKFLLEWDKDGALESVSFMKRGIVIDLDLELSINAATFSKEKKLAMADSIILATAQKYGATIWTQDSDFQHLKGVKYFKKD